MMDCWINGKRLLGPGIALLYFGLAGCARSVTPNQPTNEPTGELQGSVYGTLTIEHSPYSVAGTITVDSGASLSINAGVHVLFSDSAALIIHGELVCNGGQGNPVLLSSKNGHWPGMVIGAPASRSTLRFVIIENVDITNPPLPERNGAVDVLHANVTITNSIFFS